MKKNQRTLIIILSSVIFLALCLLFGAFFVWKNNYRDRVYPGIKIGNVDLGGKTFDETKKIVTARAGDITTAGLKFRYGQKNTVLATDVASFDSDLSYPAVTFDPEQTALNAYGDRSDKTFWHYLLNIFTPKKQKEIKAVYNLDQQAIRSFLADNYKELNISPENAYFSASENGRSEIVLQNNPERIGKEINYGELLDEVRANLDNLQNNTVIIKTQSKYPTIKQADLAGLEGEAKKIINRGDLTLRLQASDNGTSTEDVASTTDYWKIKPNKLITWVSVRPGSSGLSISLDLEKIKAYLLATISPKVDLEVVRPRFEIINGRVSSWLSGKSGRQLDIDATANQINADYANGLNETNIITKEIKDDSLTVDNNFNIKEVLGTGHSKFSGSSANRRHNIKVGAAALHGLLIKPGEEFSMIKTLGDVSDKTGYLPELVIKGNKTVPEYGGGLCQIGTTVFRAALSTGLPITMRQNHSYRVSYYEPAGTDATIYIPQPDLRFVNDTGNYILIQARIAKDDLYFDFWGVKDGRIATTTYPVIYNIVKPEPTKIVESTDLKPGQKKCTESSHNGADAYFDYTVIYPEGTDNPIHKRRFKSHYVPWRAVCLVGKSATSTPVNSTSTSSQIPETGTSTDNKKAADISAASSSKQKN